MILLIVKPFATFSNNNFLNLLENHMDCCFANQYDSSQIAETCPNVSSPEMFDSDTESDIDNKHVETLADNGTLAVIPLREPTQAELIAKSDSYMLVRINKYLSGVPPPPRHTTCQSDCSDFLQHIYKNRQLFCNGYPLSNGSSESTESIKSDEQRISETNDRNVSYQCTKGTPRNLTNAFDACDLPVNSAEGIKLGINKSDNDNVQYSVSMEIKNSVNIINKETVPPIADNADVSHERSPLLYHTIDEKEAKALTWPQAYSHKFHGIQ